MSNDQVRPEDMAYVLRFPDGRYRGQASTWITSPGEAVLYTLAECRRISRKYSKQWRPRPVPLHEALKATGGTCLPHEPAGGISEVQALKLSSKPEGGTYCITFTTKAIPWDATQEEVQAAIREACDRALLDT